MNVNEIKKSMKLRGVAIIDRSGIIEEEALPKDLNKEMFSVMCAALYGAANTINKDVLKSSTKKIKLEGSTDNILISPYNNRHFIVFIAPKDMNMENFDFQRSNEI